MRNVVKANLAIVFALSTVAAFAAEIQTDIDAALSGYIDAKEKADKARERSVSKARLDAIRKLEVSAKRAFGQKNRDAETNAYRGLLGVDRNHPEARKYFMNLGTLQRELDQLPAEESPLRRMAGKWRLRNTAGGLFDVAVAADGTFTYFESNGTQNVWSGQLVGSSIVVLRKVDNTCDRWTLAGDKVLFEQWWNMGLTIDPTKEPAFAYGWRLPE